MSKLDPSELKKIREGTLDLTLSGMAGKLGLPRADYRKMEKGEMDMPEDIGEMVDEIVAEYLSDGSAPKKSKKEPKKKEVAPATKKPPEVAAPVEKGPAAKEKAPKPDKPKEASKAEEKASERKEVKITPDGAHGLSDLVVLLSVGKKLVITVTLED